MLSTKTVGNVNEAKHYFLGYDNYYTQENELAKECSEWWGKGAQSLQLKSNIDSELFTQLLKGHLPDGQQLGKKTEQEIKHRAGFDLTFSAPKSVSILTLLGGDKRILTALQSATDKTLSMIERACAQARVTRDGVTTYENTQNLVVAKFLHDISREADPQLHVHCVVMNMTQRSDGQWRSLASQSGKYGLDVPGEVNGFLERVRHHKHHFGALFRAELAFEMKQLGYEIVKTGNNNLFEIAGISPKTIETYSQRAKQIDAYMSEYGFSGAKAAAVATIKTRQAKRNINRETLSELWRARSQMHNIDAYQEANTVVAQALNQEKNITKNGLLNFQTAKDAIQYAIEHLSETQVALKEIQLINVATQQVIGENITTSCIVEALKEFLKQGVLIPLEHKVNENYFTTQKLLQYERDILHAIHKKIENGKPITEKERIEAYLAQQTHLTGEQKQAIKIIFSSDKYINLLEGATGTGKTYLIKHMMELAKLDGYRSVLLTSSSAGSAELKQQLRTVPKTFREWVKNLFDKNEYDTVSHFIKTHEKLINTGQVIKQKSIIFIDNATLLSTKQMHDLTLLAEKLDYRLIPIGDRKSLLSWQSGTPFTQMLDKGAVCAILSHNQRQQETYIKSAIEDSLQSNIASAFSKISHRIISVENKEQRLDAMAAHYAALDPLVREKTLVLMPTKAQCEEINVIIREKLKDYNQLGQNSSHITVLLPKSFSEAQYKYAKNYKEGDWVRFNENFKSINTHRGEYLKIKSIQATRNVVILENNQSDTISWNPARAGGKSGFIEVFEEKARELVVGDILFWKRGNKTYNIHNGERFKVAAIKNHQLILMRDNQKQIKIDLRLTELRHFDYGYAATPIQKHYAVTDNIIAYQNSFSNQTNQRLFYKELSQAKQNVWIYTENKETLFKSLQKLTGDKITAMDTLLCEKEFINKNASVLKSDYLHLLEKAILRTIEDNQQKLQLTKLPETLAKEAVQYALAHLAEREAAFLHKQVLEVALTHVLGELDSKTVQAAIQQAEKNGELIRGIYSQDGTRWTTPAAIAIERKIMQLATDEKGQLSPIADAKIIEQHLARIQPKSEHAEAIRTICTNRDRFLLVQGFAGTGKTTMLKYIELLIQVETTLKGQGYSLLCLAPMHVAVKELKVRGLAAQTLDSFLVSNRPLSNEIVKHNNKLMIALDENSMTSNRRMLEVLEIMKAREIRGIYIGDKKQHPAIESGKPHILLENRIKTIYLQDIERQKEATLLKAVKESYQGNFASAFQTLGNRIIEVGNEIIDGKEIDCFAKRLEAACNAYLSLNPKERARTQVITLGNEERVIVNAAIREGLKAEGELYGQSITTKILVPRDMTEVEKTRVTNYQCGNQIRFGYSDNVLEVKRGDYLTVRDIDTRQNLLVLEDVKGRICVWSPPKLQHDSHTNVEVYSVEKRELMAGDIIRWTRSDAKLGLLSPELAKIEAVEDKKILLKHVKITEEGITADGNTIVIKPHEEKYQHWDHAYVITDYGVQSKTFNKIIVVLESYHKHLTNQPAWIVALSRAAYEIVIYTDDKQALLKQILKNTGEKTSALETVGEWKDTSKRQPYISLIEKSSLIKNPAQLALSLESNQSTRTTTSPKSRFLDSKKITQLLHENTEMVVERILGEPKERTGNQYRYGSKQGSLIVTLQGDKRGLWHDFQTGEGGNLLHLIAKQSGLDMQSDFRKVLGQAGQILGMQESPGTSQTQRSIGTKKPNQETFKNPQILSEEQKRSLYYARRLARESKPIEGTLAEQYLRKHRGIQLEKLPASFRFHPAIYSNKNESIQPALLVIAKDSENKVQAVQAIFLDEVTANKAQVKVQKQTWGLPSSGVFVELAASKNFAEPVYLAEGPETGLSIFEAMPNANVKITLGKSNFKNIDPAKTTKDIVLCLDNDGNNPNTEKLIHFAAQRLIENGKEVWIAKPEEFKKDYNDLLKEFGTLAVKTNIEQAIPFQFFRDKTVSAVTLKSAILDKLKSLQNADGQSFDNKITNIDWRKFEGHKLLLSDQKMNEQILETASHLLKQTESLEQNKVDKYLSSIKDNKQQITQQPHPFTHKIEHISIKKDREKETEL